MKISIDDSVVVTKGTNKGRIGVCINIQRCIYGVDSLPKVNYVVDFSDANVKKRKYTSDEIEKYQEGNDEETEIKEMYFMMRAAAR